MTTTAATQAPHCEGRVMFDSVAAVFWIGDEEEVVCAGHVCYCLSCSLVELGIHVYEDKGQVSREVSMESEEFAVSCVTFNFSGSGSSVERV